MARVYVTRQIPQKALDKFDAAGISYEVYDKDEVIPRDVLLEKVQGVDGVLCILTDAIDAEVFEKADQAKIFANYAVGFNNVDLDEATKRGIAITNTPGVLTDATADLTWTLIFSTARRVVESDIFMRAGKYHGWGPLMLLGQDISERTLGVVGMGRIGQAVAQRAAAFRMKIHYYDAQPCPEFEESYPYEVKFMPLDDVLKTSDVVTLHVPLLPETKHLISDAQFELMQSHAILVNTSRGPVVDEAALVRALQNKTIWAAGLDVYEEEPKAYPGLFECENTVLLPHLGSATEETRTRMGEIAVENLIAFFEGTQPPNLLNPDVWKK